MSCSFAKEALKICVAQICQNIGWHAVQSSPMEILVDVIHRYLLELSKSVHGYSTQYNRTIPNLDDLGLAFKDFGVNLQEIEEYVNNVEPVPFVQKVPVFPVKHQSNLQHPKPESRELALRPEHIPEYLPLMHPELEEEDNHFPSHSSADGVKKNIGDINNIRGDSPSPHSSPKHGSKRPNDWSSDTLNKKPRYYSEEEGRPMREVTSVFMSPAGFISPVHEGKAAESSLPCLVDSPPSSPEPPSHSLTPGLSKKDSKSKDIKKEKSKSKKEKESSKRDSKKLKTSKKEKENKENAVKKSEKAASSSLSVKKDHSSFHKSSGKSDKSGKSEESFRSKSKTEKSKFKARKSDVHKMKDNFKLSKSKSKLKHAMMSSSSSIKSPKLSSSKKFKSMKSPKIRSPKPSISKITVSQPPPVRVDITPKEDVEERKTYTVEMKETRPEIDIEEPLVIDEIDDYREESPEPERLVIDDSIEAQVRQERESRLAVLDKCIEAVIRRAEEESEVETVKTHKAMDETINEVIRGPNMMRKLEPKDIYDFTDTSDSSSLSSSDIPSHSPVRSPVKREKKSAEAKGRKSDSPKKSKGKEKQKKRGSKESKSRSPTGYTSPRNRSSNFILKVDDRTPSPSDIRDDLLSSDDSTPCASPSSNASFFDATPSPKDHVPTPPPFVPSAASSPGYTSNPFAPIRPLPCHIQANPHFPTPPLFVTPTKSESSASFQNIQPLNLAKSSTPKVSPESKAFESNMLSAQSPKVDGTPDLRKTTNLFEKAKLKDHKKEKVDKKDKFKKKGKDKKESEKAKERREKEDIKEKSKLKEKSKIKPEKVVKVDKRKTKLDKKKGKEKEDKIKEDSTVPKMTLKLTSGSNSTKIFIKSSKNSSAPSSPVPSEPEMEPTPSPPPHIPTPSPPRVATPPPPARERTPSPSPEPVVVPSPPMPEPEPEEESPPLAPPPVTKTQHSRGRGRGRKAAVQQVIPPARTVITETLGTIIDESGNKIWICPACSRADDGSPMIGCDGCDDWYHWICVGIVVPPKEEENWFCSRCVSKRQGSTVKRRRKKHRKDK